MILCIFVCLGRRPSVQRVPARPGSFPGLVRPYSGKHTWDTPCVYPPGLYLGKHTWDTPRVYPGYPGQINRAHSPGTPGIGYGMLRVLPVPKTQGFPGIWVDTGNLRQVAYGTLLVYSQHILGGGTLCRVPRVYPAKDGWISRTYPDNQGILATWPAVLTSSIRACLLACVRARIGNDFWDNT